jgi:hypothetical protein
MEIAGGGTGPSAAVAELTTSAAAALEPERIDPRALDTGAGARSRWIKPISSYARREIAHAEDSASYG